MGCRVPPAGERVSPHEHDAGDGLVSVDDHLALVLDAVAPLDAYAVPLSAARGRTLREPVTAMVDIPVFDNSAMDGFAVLFDDVANASARVSRDAHGRRGPARGHGARPADRRAARPRGS